MWSNQKYLFFKELLLFLKILNPFFFYIYISSYPSSGFYFSCPGHIYALENKWKYLRHKIIANDMILWFVHDYQAVLSLFRSNYVSWVCAIVKHLHHARKSLIVYKLMTVIIVLIPVRKDVKIIQLNVFYRFNSFWRFVLSVKKSNSFSLSFKKEGKRAQMHYSRTSCWRNQKLS